jgi:hypothetical protein
MLVERDASDGRKLREVEMDDPNGEVFAPAGLSQLRSIGSEGRAPTIATASST